MHNVKKLPSSKPDSFFRESLGKNYDDLQTEKDRLNLEKYFDIPNNHVKIVEKSREQPGPSDYSATDLRPVKRRSLLELKNLLGADVDVGQMRSSNHQQIVAEGE